MNTSNFTVVLSLTKTATKNIFLHWKKAKIKYKMKKNEILNYLEIYFKKTNSKNYHIKIN